MSVKISLKRFCDNIKVLADKKAKTVTDVDLRAIADNVLKLIIKTG